MKKAKKDIDNRWLKLDILVTSKDVIDFDRLSAKVVMFNVLSMIRPVLSEILEGARRRRTKWRSSSKESSEVSWHFFHSIIFTACAYVSANGRARV